MHAPGTLPQMRSALNYPAGHETSLRLEALARTRLGEPFSQCTDRTFLDFQGESVGEYIYSPSLCENVCHQSQIVRNCSCIDVGVQATPSMLQKYNFCGKWESNMTESILRVACREAFSAKEPCQCLLPCEEKLYVYDSGSSPWPGESYQLHFYDKYIHGRPYAHRFQMYAKLANQARVARYYNNYSHEFLEEIHDKLRSTDLMARNFAQLNVFFDKSMVTELKDEESITVPTLLANVGGSLNLWIGITFCTLVELVDLVYRLICQGQNKEQGHCKGQGHNQERCHCDSFCSKYNTYNQNNRPRICSRCYMPDGVSHRYSEVYRRPVGHGQYSTIYTTEFFVNPVSNNFYDK